MTAAPLDPARVLEILRTVKDPELHVDIVSLGMIEDLRVEGDRVSLTVNLTTPGCPLKAQIEREVKEALARLPGMGAIALKMGAKVRRSIETTGDLIPEVANVVAIGSGKGGVGKSTVSVNLALAFARAGATVGLLDADIYGPNDPHLLGVKGKPEVVDRRLQPVTAHVDFTALRRAAEGAGARCLGLTTQARFLLALGALEFLPEAGTGGASSDSSDPVEAIKEREALKELVLPGRMGDKFRVLVLGIGDVPRDLAGLSRPWLRPLPGNRLLRT